jgi:hypothetical protein
MFRILCDYNLFKSKKSTYLNDLWTKKSLTGDVLDEKRPLTDCIKNEIGL